MCYEELRMYERHVRGRCRWITRRRGSWLGSKTLYKRGTTLVFRGWMQQCWKGYAVGALTSTFGALCGGGRGVNCLLIGGDEGVIARRPKCPERDAKLIISFPTGLGSI